MIRTDSDEYFIEPLERGTQEHEESGRVHVVYRRSAVLQAQSDISSDHQPIGMYHSMITVWCMSPKKSAFKIFLIVSHVVASFIPLFCHSVFLNYRTKIHICCFLLRKSWLVAVSERSQNIHNMI